MRDTTPDARKIQAEIILAKTESERNEMGLHMIDDVYHIVKNSILEKNPTLSAADLTVEIFKRYYMHEFSEAEVERITLGIRAHASQHVQQ